MLKIDSIFGKWIQKLFFSIPSPSWHRRDFECETLWLFLGPAFLYKYLIYRYGTPQIFGRVMVRNFLSEIQNFTIWMNALSQLTTQSSTISSTNKLPIVNLFVLFLSCLSSSFYMEGTSRQCLQDFHGNTQQPTSIIWMKQQRALIGLVVMHSISWGPHPACSIHPVEAIWSNHQTGGRYGPATRSRNYR